MATLTLIRGIPGSGKSTIAKKIGGVHVEADMYFETKDGYDFDRTKIHNAHEWCIAITECNLEDDVNMVVSNTFTTMKELEPYFKIAKDFSIVPTVITLTGRNYGSIHDVPPETIQKMKNRFEYDITELFQKYGMTHA